MSAFVTTEGEGANKKLTEITDCPGCGIRLPKDVFLFCESCWWQVPTPDRQLLARLFRKDPGNIAAYMPKIMSCVRFLNLSKNSARAKRIDARIEP